MLLHVQALRAGDMCQPNVSKFVSRITHTHTHILCRPADICACSLLDYVRVTNGVLDIRVVPAVTGCF